MRCMAVLCGRARGERRMRRAKTVSAIFMFVNVSDEPITSCVEVRFDEVGLESDAFDKPLTFAPGVPWVVELE